MALKLAVLLIVSALLSDILTQTLPDEACPMIYSPVCGSDGKTYSNSCVLKATAESFNEHITAIEPGPCQGNQLPPKSCDCPQIGKPVCGSDGQTYANECFLQCMKKRDPSLTVRQSGASHFLPESECLCPALYSPVCGSDSQMYSNSCRLKCAANNNNPSLREMSDKSSCLSQLTDCDCPQEKSPVCGSDGNTYYNRCLLDCKAKTNSRLQLVHIGQCHFTNVWPHHKTN